MSHQMIENNTTKLYLSSPSSSSAVAAPASYESRLQTTFNACNNRTSCPTINENEQMQTLPKVRNSSVANLTPSLNNNNINKNNSILHNTPSVNTTKAYKTETPNVNKSVYFEPSPSTGITCIKISSSDDEDKNTTTTTTTTNKRSFILNDAIIQDTNNNDSQMNFNGNNKKDGSLLYVDAVVDKSDLNVDNHRQASQIREQLSEAARLYSHYSKNPRLFTTQPSLTSGPISLYNNNSLQLPLTNVNTVDSTTSPINFNYSNKLNRNNVSEIRNDLSMPINGNISTLLNSKTTLFY
jgi:hypothetical protein